MEEKTLEQKHKGLTRSTPFIIAAGIAIYLLVLLAAKHFEAKTQRHHKEDVDEAIGLVTRRYTSRI